MEMIDLYDRDGKLLGRTVERYAALSPGEYFLHAHMVLCAADGRFLLQRRARTKRVAPGVWDITGGGVDAGETARQAAARETREELGLVVPDEKMVLGWRYRYEGEDYHALFEVWGARLPIDMDALVLDTSECDGAKLAPLEEYVEAVCWNKDGEYRRNLTAFCWRLQNQ